MAKINVPRKPIFTHEGAKAKHINAEQQLRRSVMACMLWEDQFYENGESITDRIKNTIPMVAPTSVATIAVESREKMKLRHVPLLIVREMARIESHRWLVAETLTRIIQRPDELSEFLAIYWKDGRQTLSAQVKKGLAGAFGKFDEYQLAKWNRDGAIKLRDVLFLCHAKPKNAEQEQLWKRLIDGKLETPDTWEVALSSGGDKKAHWERLLAENKLGALAVLRNLRNFEADGVERDVVRDAISRANVNRVLPFRFITAAKYAPDMEPQLESALFRCCGSQEKLYGKTILIVDVSGSMYGRMVSENSEIDRAQAACSLAIIVRQVCESPVIYATAGSDMKRVHATSKIPPRQGFALSDAIYGMCRTLGGGGIFLKQVMDYVYEKEGSAERIIVITDEQDCGLDSRDKPSMANVFGNNNYLINVSTYKNGIGYGQWTHIDGWSESVIDYIRELERDSIKSKNLA